MYAVHNWIDALAIAAGRARATGRRQRIRWNADHLCWTVREAEAVPIAVAL